MPLSATLVSAIVPDAPAAIRRLLITVAPDGASTVTDRDLVNVFAASPSVRLLPAWALKEALTFCPGRATVARTAAAPTVRVPMFAGFDRVSVTLPVPTL